MNTNKVPGLAIAINRWISFQRLVGRGCLLSEDYLSQPVAEYLLHHHAGLLTPEDDHPAYATGAVGRPRQIDYTLRHRISNGLNIAFECKWLSGKINDNQRILNDLLRLEAIAGSGESEPSCFFIVAGEVQHFNSKLRDVRIHGVGASVLFGRELFSSPVKPKPNARHLVKVQHARLEMRPYFREFSEDYKANLPTRFFTRIVARTIDDGIAVSIWQIYSQRRRATFDPVIKWQ